MQMQFYFNYFIKWLITSGFQITIVICLMVFSFRLVNSSTEKLINKFVDSKADSELEKRAHTLRSIANSVLNIIILAVGSMIVMEKLGINIAPMLAAASVVGVAVGFGSQRLVEDIISGFIILIDDQIRVGDVVKIGDKSGLVEKIDLKMVVLRDVEGNVHFIRNGKIDSITNMTKDYSYSVFDISVSAKEDIDNIISIIKDAGSDLQNISQHKDDILEPIEILGLDKFNDSEIVIKSRIKTKPVKQWAVSREFNLILKRKFDELSIELP